ncbi:MAG TPA: lipid-A-disaccharide synthase [Candidatus Saccharimonadales bacterium]|nr:lipid-A-disaccharide synthase [Candidatus Saccharimonadales bacterium]
MKPKTFMLIAGEASGDLLAAELVSALREKVPDAKFFGAGGPKMAAAGVQLAFDLTQYSVVGFSDVLKNYSQFRRLFHQLLTLAIERQPDAIIGVDYGGFNLRFGHAIKNYLRSNPFSKWSPKIIQFVSPQVWASRPGRAKLLEADYDLLLSIFPFEKDWYAKCVPKLRVEFVGHPMVDRFAIADRRGKMEDGGGNAANILLLPGSRTSELKRHLPVMLDAVELIQRKVPGTSARMVLPNPALKQLADKLSAPPPNVEIQVGDLSPALTQAAIAIASTGTVTMECAFFGVPAVTLYQTSWFNYQIAKWIATVKWATMPNILANEEVYPEFIQNDATPENLAGAALELLQNEPLRQKIKSQLAKIVSSLGEPGASKRAAAAILSLFQ